MKMQREFNDCVAELDIESTSCFLKILRTDDSTEGFANYKRAIVSAAKRLIEVIEEEEKDHLPHMQDF